MTDSQDKPDYFQYRWGVKEWDVGFTTIPNPVLKHYSRVPWIDKDGKRGRGISNQEMLCIVHLASFHYESEEGESRPAIGTVARRMGYRKDDSVRGLIKSLEDKNLLTVKRRPGKCSVYDLLNFSRAILELEGEQPPHPNGGLHSNGGLSNGGHSSGPHSQGDEEKKVLEEGKQEEKEEKEKKEGISAFSEKTPVPPAPSPGGDGAGLEQGGDADDDRRRIHSIGSSAGGPDDHVSDPQPEVGDDFDAGTEKMWEFSRQARAHQDAGRNWAAPAQAGGDDGLGAFGLFCLYDKRSKAPPKQGTKQHRQQCDKVTEALRAYGYQRAAPELVEKAAEIHCQRKGAWVNVFYKSFVPDFGEALQDAEYFMEHGRLPDEGGGKQARDGPDKFRRARAMTLERLNHGNQ